MQKNDYINKAKLDFLKYNVNLLTSQINNFFNYKDELKIPKFKVGEKVFLKKGTLLHGTTRNLAGLHDIVSKGYICGYFNGAKRSRYPYCVSAWFINKDYDLKDYINYYSGGTIKYFNSVNDDKAISEVIPFDEMDTIMDRVIKNGFCSWKMEETREARFMPSLSQTAVQIGIIYDPTSESAKKLIKNDILNPSLVSNKNLRGFVNEKHLKEVLRERTRKDAFFTDRECAILFGLPTKMIEGILVGRNYEKNETILTEIKELLPNAYICNLDGIVIR